MTTSDGSGRSPDFQTAKSILAKDLNSGQERRATTQAGPSKRIKVSHAPPPTQVQLVSLTDSEDENDSDDPVFIDTRPLHALSPNSSLSSSRQLTRGGSSSSSSYPSKNWDRGVPIWVKKRDEARARKAEYGYTPRHASGSSSSSTRGRMAAAQVEESDDDEGEDGVVLSPQQESIRDKVLKGENCFFTGSAGTGKSVLLRAIVRALKARNKARGLPKRDGFAITASTGMAGINIRGSTVHSWGGFGTGVGPVDVLIEKVRGWAPAREAWLRTHILIIDEISMIDGKLFDKMDAIGRAIRGSSAPFGGIQLILSGDFHQLPPVSKAGEPPATYCFESHVWDKAFDPSNLACLRQVFRQRDESFVQILEEMRKGRISTHDEGVMVRLARKVVYDDGVPPVQLFPTRREVDFLNDTKLAELSSEERSFDARDMAGQEADGRRVPLHRAVEMLDNYTRFLRELTLKVGAVVMLVQNQKGHKLVNGSMGKVVDFVTEEEAAKQGVSTLSFEEARTGTDTKFPLVEFIPHKYAKPATPSRVVITPQRIDIPNPDGKTRKAWRVQVPLILAWGLTIHKAQGQSLERVKIDLQRTFAEGQAYVAISRAVSMDGLELLNFNRQKLKVDSRVVEWSYAIECDV